MSFFVGVAVGVVLVLIVLKIVSMQFSVSTKFARPETSGSSVLVTGASRGIGTDIAKRLASKGFRVYACVRKPADGEVLKKWASQCQPKAEVVPLILDVTNPQQIAEAVKTVVAQEKGRNGLVGLVNNAGVNVGAYPVEFLQADVLARQLDINVVGQVRVTTAFLPLLRRTKGRVVFMGSVAGSISPAFGGAYSASKFAVEALTDSLRRELLPWKMSVSIVKPAELKTDILTRYQEDMKRINDDLPPEGRRFYGQFYEGAKATKAKFVGEVSMASDAVLHALTSATPKTRYVVGSKPMMKNHLYPFATFGLKMPFWSVAPDRFVDKQLKKVWPKRYAVPQEL